jgi:hypothetical protein
LLDVVALRSRGSGSGGRAEAMMEDEGVTSSSSTATDFAWLERYLRGRMEAMRGEGEDEEIDEAETQRTREASVGSTASGTPRPPPRTARSSSHVQQRAAPPVSQPQPRSISAGSSSTARRSPPAAATGRPAAPPRAFAAPSAPPSAVRTRSAGGRSEPISEAAPSSGERHRVTFSVDSNTSTDQGPGTPETPLVGPTSNAAVPTLTSPFTFTSPSTYAQHAGSSNSPVFGVTEAQSHAAASALKRRLVSGGGRGSAGHSSSAPISSASLGHFASPSTPGGRAARKAAAAAARGSGTLDLGGVGAGGRSSSGAGFEGHALSPVGEEAPASFRRLRSHSPADARTVRGLRSGAEAHASGRTVDASSEQMDESDEQREEKPGGRRGGALLGSDSGRGKRRRREGSATNAPGDA